MSLVTISEGDERREVRDEREYYPSRNVFVIVVCSVVKDIYTAIIACSSEKRGVSSDSSLST